MRGCGESLPRLHTLQKAYMREPQDFTTRLHRPHRAFPERRFDKRDCFYHFRSSITEVI
jgi:hypothetical protein